MYYSIFSLDLERCSIEKLGGKSFTFMKIDFWDPQTLIYNCESSTLAGILCLGKLQCSENGRYWFL